MVTSFDRALTFDDLIVPGENDALRLGGVGMVRSSQGDLRLDPGHDAEVRSAFEKMPRQATAREQIVRDGVFAAGARPLQYLEMAEANRSQPDLQFARDLQQFQPKYMPNARSYTPEIDAGDVAKSAGIGLVNGGIKIAGALPDLSAGITDLTGRYLFDPVLRAILGPPPELRGRPPFDIDKFFGSENIRKGVERFTGEFYQPRTAAGRYAETIGELAPLPLASGGAGIVRGGAGLADAIRQVGIDAILPGLLTQGVREYAPDSPAGSVVRYAYPVVRRGLPFALAARRY
ncbi:hypothetical protein JQ557_15660 [Bradyrhizobium sp. U87765 SZCCT0131]|uniref:hypothetical protein n=1 Tax=unclassified Bradyrhizobium TaxID=2631580 RepID=UPI001BA61C02|nr:MULTISPECIES: hypothetical protein [unclassified Bradyrhizobium]MBR1219440.1 hypothetical protein [Bradyrhizobium sp. U87765 SZCCT0131]MBR1262091.1 hypothetical protein [Bradyrhizobium sp. U87765 SZCCT0134]MBR1306056.1 hypothetical protein [Bradyrhizobium sp. U87765 SZCCT0110]MBR1317873.1 hypothetical protein [Bradyrhizobium sp. U87765 SZCCT0109]MBR1351575.1 hypothetical protein [Bradyrhizobium sp. U87765 SZCCT0048]